MNVRRVEEHLKKKCDDFLSSITNKKVRNKVKDKIIISGGAIVSLLDNQKPNDYDMYIADKESCIALAGYYVNRFNNKN